MYAEKVWATSSVCRDRWRVAIQGRPTVGARKPKPLMVLMEEVISAAQLHGMAMLIIIEILARAGQCLLGFQVVQHESVLILNNRRASATKLRTSTLIYGTIYNKWFNKETRKHVVSPRDIYSFRFFVAGCDILGLFAIMECAGQCTCRHTPLLTLCSILFNPVLKLIAQFCQTFPFVTSNRAISI